MLVNSAAIIRLDIDLKKPRTFFYKTEKHQNAPLLLLLARRCCRSFPRKYNVCAIHNQGNPNNPPKNILRLNSSAGISSLVAAVSLLSLPSLLSLLLLLLLLLLLFDGAVAVDETGPVAPGAGAVPSMAG